ncbi:uncharacterized protein TNCV_347831 [Trichonephila clavipes]|nr:uncharacterized protein TNCV_347831 [Trichonephila clavipes]
MTKYKTSTATLSNMWFKILLPNHPLAAMVMAKSTLDLWTLELFSVTHDAKARDSRCGHFECRIVVFDHVFRHQCGLGSGGGELQIVSRLARSRFSRLVLFQVVPGWGPALQCGALPRPLLVADSRASPAKLVLLKSKGILLLLSKKKFKISQNKKNIQNASFKTPIPPFPTHDADVLPARNIDTVSTHTRFLLLSLPNNEMPNKSPFAVHKALLGIGGELKTVKRLRSGDLLIETNSAIQTKSFLLAKTFLNSPLIVTPHKSLNSCRGVISEPDLLTTSESEILEGFSDQSVIQVRRITIKKNTTVFPTKHLILTFNSPNLPTSIKGSR